jgi:erythromycin esterase-like protein
MIGEASHGTHEFYAHRAEITRRLIQEKGFTAIAVEADWPDAYRVNRFVQHGKKSRDTTAEEALGDFRRRFPLWMWRNTVVENFIDWLRNYNATLPPKRRVAFYGMDLYSMFGSMDAVIEYLEKVSPNDAEVAKKRYSHFDRFQGDPQSYGFASAAGVSPSYRDAVVRTLVDLREKGEEYLKGAGGLIDGDELFYAEQNAQLVANAEKYYSAMFSADEVTWNIRDTHMADCVEALLKFHERKHDSPDQKIVLWAHNSHLGDSAATEVSRYGQLNIGHLLRKRFKGDSFTIGFSSCSGSVTAAPKWDEPAHYYPVKGCMKGSWEEVFHEFAANDVRRNFYLLFNSHSAAHHIDPDLVSEFSKEHLERYIGVIYRPQTERASHMSRSRLAKEYDALIYLDETRALQPLDTTPEWLEGHSRHAEKQPGSSMSV